MNYCYVSLLYSHNNKCDYLEGVLLTGLGLRKQNVKYPLICLVTSDVSLENREIILKIWDKVIEVEYISPIPNLNGILIKNILDPNFIHNNNSLIKIFTKFHIFNYNILPYDKILFIDSDHIPLSDFDKIFDLYDTPAGWLEVCKKNPDGSYFISWGTHPFKDNQLIPIDYINVEKNPLNINAGLLLIKPDNNIFKEIIDELKNNNFKYMNLDGKVNNYYWCEQSYLTNKFLGKWHYINHLYNSWGFYDNSKSLHMAGLKYNINNNVVNSKTWLIQRIYNDGFNYKTNEIVLWGMINYPFLKNILFNNLKLIIADNLINFKDIDNIFISFLHPNLQTIFNLKYK